MLLSEIESKQLLSDQGLSIPDNFLLGFEDFLENPDLYGASKTGKEFKNSKIASAENFFVKAQVLHGNRAQQGLVIASKKKDLNRKALSLFQKHDYFNNKIDQILIEEAVKYQKSYYLAIKYDTNTRTLVCLYSQQGGEGMDDRGDTVQTTTLSILKKPTNFKLDPELTSIVQKMWQVFISNDATLVEINPLVKTQTQNSFTLKNDNDWLCLDAKIELEDVASYRHPEWSQYPQRSAFGRPPTSLELRAQQISRSDHRGVAGESFFELPDGKIGVMASGGGASTLAMDALLLAGLKPANYTEYSGNPSREKVYQLTKVVLSLPNLKGLFIVGSNANFTDICETLSGVVDGFLESNYALRHSNSKPFAILIRRGGPHWQEAFRMVEERLSEHIRTRSIKIKLLGPDFPLLDTANEMKKLLI
jgi:succinyl-CoA synthetase beta subunit